MYSRLGNQSTDKDWPSEVQSASMSWFVTFYFLILSYFKLMPCVSNNLRLNKWLNLIWTIKGLRKLKSNRYKMLYMLIYEKGVAMVKWFSHQLSNQEVSGLNLAIANFILELDSSAFFYPPSSRIASCVGTAGTVHDAYTWHGPAMYL